jgi:glycosyltransferase involved in cell wall biosynthesis
MKKFPVCYILSYYEPNYIRTRTLLKALQEIDTIHLYQARNVLRGFLRYFQTMWRLFIVRLRNDPKVYILGFRGYEFFWIVRLMTRGRTLIYDHMMSPYDSIVNEHKYIKADSFLARLIFQYERAILQSSDLILTDTSLHKTFFQKTFNVDPAKICAVPVGTDEDVFIRNDSLQDSANHTSFEVLFYGSFLPLHGMEIILRSAAIVHDHPIHFTLIGGNKRRRAEINRMIQRFGLENLTHLDWVNFESLPDMISRADIGLGGPFGGTGQAQRVITGKTFQFLAMAKPAIIGKTDTGYGFEDKINCLIVPQGNAPSLADAIIWSFENKTRLAQIGRKGYDLYQAHFSTKCISECLRESFRL